jgi:hypothetical protein
MAGKQGIDVKRLIRMGGLRAAYFSGLLRIERRVKKEESTIVTSRYNLGLQHLFGVGFN